MKRELTLTDIAGYLPYGLKVTLCDGDSPTTVFEMKYHPIKGDQRAVCGINTELRLSEITPVLRPMSGLTKQITHKGETFVPIMKFIRERMPYFKWDDSRHKIEIDDSYIYVRVYSRTLNAWGTEMSLHLNIGRIDKLSEWMFDYRGLIDMGLAISVYDLHKNPYE